MYSYVIDILGRVQGKEEDGRKFWVFIFIIRWEYMDTGWGLKVGKWEKEVAGQSEYSGELGEVLFDEQREFCFCKGQIMFRIINLVKGEMRELSWLFQYYVFYGFCFYLFERD